MAGNVAAKDDPSTPSRDHKAMADDWRMIRDILAGAKWIKEAGIRYLPRFQKESQTAYDLRRDSTPWRPEFVDALRSLCSKPFSKEVVVNPDAPDAVQGKAVDQKTKKRQGGFVDDVDGQGNSLHVFARDTFANGVAFGLEAIYVAWSADQPLRTRAEEQLAGARPYWIHIRAENILALYSKRIGGRTVVSHIRILECTVEQDGFEEIEVQRVRVLELNAANQPVWQLFKANADGGFVAETQPAPLLGVSDIPVALFFTGERSGNYRVRPPLIDLAWMQIELYRAMSRKEQILTLAGSPMLKAKGMVPPQPSQVTDASGRVIDVPAPQIEVGPGTVLFAPPAAEGVQSDWDYVQPAAANMKEVREDVDGIMEDFRRLALQPTTPKSGNMVATGQAIDAAKSHSAVEVWANGLVDALNQALMYTCQWLKIADTVTAVVHTDFGVDIQGADEAKIIGDAQKRGVLSKQTERAELARRGILGPDFDEDEEVVRIAGDEEGLDLEEIFNPVNGETA
ncbi:DUF4055 domain-containing protein [Tardiphaga sp. 839_C3_N1_4]|uniref:DUF4055 domain-containing protein n=1 Tax=Tardiphaga sp. 839_C3_N1_4 TaxID=3240761 RepID=UPI003F25F4BF